MVAATSIAAAVAPVLGHLVGYGPASLASHPYDATIFAISMFAMAGLMAVFMRSYSEAIDQVERQAAKVAELVEGSPDAMVSLDPNGRVEAFNQAAERLLYTPRTEAIGRLVHDLPLDLVGKTDSDEATPLLFPKDGDRVELEVADRGVVLEALARRATRAGGQEGTLLVLRDITERKMAERRARTLQQQLERAQRMEAIGLLAGGVAHDVNNLLTVVGAFASLSGDSDDPDVREMSGELMEVQERGAELTRRLLTFARQDIAQPQAIDLAEALANMGNLLRRLLGERHVLDLDLEGPCPVVADPNRIQQVMLNLVANARDAMPEGGTVFVGCRNDQPNVLMEVRDHGTGMEAETVERIFEPFYTLKPRGHGTGLGLSTVRGIVDDAGGRIEVETALAMGTTFRIHWPLTDQPHVPLQPPIRHKTNQKRQGTILLVEDDVHTRDFVCRILERAGFTIIEAGSGTEALALVSRSETHFDLLLTDVMMPGINGAELATRLRDREPDTTVLFMSGYLDDVLDDPAFDATEDLVLKPFSGEELLQRIDRKLQMRVSAE